MGKRLFFLGLLPAIIISTAAQSGGIISREQYIETYAEIAMKEMVRTGIPASITLAQGCLESDNGNSRLAVKANNHFGIKCHDWVGRKIHHDDDEKNECFRKYKSAYESYIDHSQFLTTKERYQFLFEYASDDYVNWAKGLKKAGYATNPKYAEHLINIIESNELFRYDQLVIAGGELVPGDKELFDEVASREVFTRNNIEYIIVKEGDTPESLRDELDLYKNELYKYNNLDSQTQLEPGQMLYLQPKRRKAERGSEIHVVKEGETMYDISQKYGVKLKYLYKRNGMEEGQYLPEGTEIFLRKKRRDPVFKIEPVEEEPEEEMRFEFEN